MTLDINATAEAIANRILAGDNVTSVDTDGVRATYSSNMDEISALLKFQQFQMNERRRRQPRPVFYGLQSIQQRGPVRFS